MGLVGFVVDSRAPVSILDGRTSVSEVDGQAPVGVVDGRVPVAVVGMASSLSSVSSLCDGATPICNGISYL